MWRITTDILEELGETGMQVSGANVTYLHIYGPSGKMSHYFTSTWLTADAMRSDLYQNHGGGVPPDVIDRLVAASEVNDAGI